MSTPLFAIYQYLNQGQEAKIPGFFAVSTAPPNVEDQSNPDADNPLKAKDPKLLDDVQLLPPQTAIQTVASCLLEKNHQGDKSVELVIAVHGYNTPIDFAKWWYREIWSFVNGDPLCSSERAVFLGYRWSSERSDIVKNLPKAIRSLPVILAALFFGGIAGAIAAWLHSNQITFGFVLCVISAAIVLTLMILRLIVYFRDSYRAINFGVPDLVEIIRQLNKELKGKVEPNSIQLNFIAHSMGAFVATNTIRILSDVFDPSSVGEIDATGKDPSSTIGDVFCLGRLVLSAPDIPARTIITGRANFLRSSLRRFKEAYLFSNEGDLALRLASTAANYFSYPTNQRIEGHRLGNVTVRPGRKSDDPVYGVVNAGTLIDKAPDSHLVNYLEINTLNQSVPLTQLQLTNDEDEEDLCDSFTCFDCTAYVDRRYRNGRMTPAHNVLSYRLDRFPPAFSFLNVFVYLALIFAWLTGKIDVHGGYFEGEFSRGMIYKLAFSGFQDFLLTFDSAETPLDVRRALDDLNLKITKQEAEHQALPTDDPKRQELGVTIGHLHTRKAVILFEYFSDQCAQKEMQIAFSPKLYRDQIWQNLRT